MTILRMILTVFLAVSFLTCFAEDEEAGKKVKGKIKFPEIKDHQLTLEVVSPEREFYAGDDNAQIRFRLINDGTKRVVIYEWMNNEPDNIIIYYHPYVKGLKKFVKSEWKAFVPELPDNPKRFNLELAPGNSVFVDKKLSFIKNINPNTIPEKNPYIYIVGVLNLSSLSLRSRPVVIKIK